jgi:hypothetical protein
LGLEIHARSVSPLDASVMEELRWSWHQSMRGDRADVGSTKTYAEV